MKKAEVLLAGIQEFVVRGGPQEHEYEELLEVFDDLLPFKQDHTDRIFSLQQASRGAFNSLKTLQGHVCLKPYGYHGDFEIIDRIYQKTVASEPMLENWDRFFHWGSAAIAVRNRKDFFKSVITSRHSEKGTGINILNVASGPCRDLSELLDELHPEAMPQVDCIDIDGRSFDYARSVVGLDSPFVTFRERNALRFTSEKAYDLIWSAGLFDYMTDSMFVLLLKRLAKSLVPGGNLIVGNFSEKNTQRSYMEFGGWMLNHRSYDELFRLAALANFEPGQVSVLSEPSGVNLFLQIAAE